MADEQRDRGAVRRDQSPAPPGPSAAPHGQGLLDDAADLLRQLSTQREQSLLSSVEALRREIDELLLPLELSGVGRARAERRAVRAQLDDYVLPRLRAHDGPLLAVVGGSTGAGKSTLVNSLLGANVSRASVLRPTTRSPLIIHHPDDAAAFTGQRVLPELARLNGADPAQDEGVAGADAGVTGLRLIASTALPSGLALLDAPDVDSVVRGNRRLARQLLAAGDLWLFVTTAARYADAVPWELLLEAAERGTSLAMVLDRVPSEAIEEVRADLARMLRSHELGNAPLFVIPEVGLDDERLPDEVIDRLRSWLTALARDTKGRAMVIRRTLVGALRALDGRVDGLAVAAQAQRDAVQALRGEVTAAYDGAERAVGEGLTDGTLLRGEVLARWQELVGTGELLRNADSSLGRVRDRVRSAVRGRPTPSAELGEALQTGVAALVRTQAFEAAADAARRWRATPAGAALVAGQAGLEVPSVGLDERVEQMVRDWQAATLQLVRDEGGRRRSAARVLSYGVNGLGVVLMLVVFSQRSRGPATDAPALDGDAGDAGGAALVAQRLLVAVFGDEAVRTLARKAHDDLAVRVRELLDHDRRRLDDVLDGLELDSRPTALQPAQQLQAALRAVAARR